MVAVTPELLLAPRQSVSLGYIVLGLAILVILQPDYYCLLEYYFL